MEMKYICFLSGRPEEEGGRKGGGAGVCACTPWMSLSILLSEHRGGQQCFISHVCR